MKKCKRILITFAAVAILGACSNNDDCIILDKEIGSICGGQAMSASIIQSFSLPVIRATLGDKSILLLVDTGAEKTVISSTLLSKTDDTFVQLKNPLCIGNGFCLEDTVVLAWDSVFSTPDAGQINGVLGMDILKHFVLTISHGLEVTLNMQGDRCEGASFPLTYNDKGSPIADIGIDDFIVEDVLLDTGAAVCLLSAATSDLLDAYFKENAVETEGCSINGCVEQGIFLSAIRKLCVEDQCLESVETKYPVWDAVGDSYFSAFSITFDFIQDQLVFCETSP